MATRAAFGDLEFGAGEFGSIDVGVETATGSFDLNGSGDLTGQAFGIAAALLELNGSAVGTNSITGVAEGGFELVGSAAGFQARFVKLLDDCGHPVYAIRDWQNDDL